MSTRDIQALVATPDDMIRAFGQAREGRREIQRLEHILLPHLASECRYHPRLSHGKRRTRASLLAAGSARHPLSHPCCILCYTTSSIFPLKASLKTPEAATSGSAKQQQTLVHRVRFSDKGQSADTTRSPLIIVCDH